MSNTELRVVCMADTHMMTVSVPEGEILIHAGDMTNSGSVAEIRNFNRWLAGLPHRHKIVIAGNHDWLFEKDRGKAEKLLSSALYLQDELVIVENLRIWGSPWQPEFQNWAFNLPRGPKLRRVWEQIPLGLDILVTHGPPAGICDTTRQKVSAGCPDLRDVVLLRRPRLHVFGHIHESGGSQQVDQTFFVNAALSRFDNSQMREPFVVSLGPNSVHLMRGKGSSKQSLHLNNSEG